jgi:hypothetical protein
MVQYKTIIWDTYGGYNCALTRLPLLYDLAKFRSQNPRLAGSVQGRIQPNLLALFLAAGGHLLICGEQPMTMTINRGYFVGVTFPFIFRYELEGDQDGDYIDQAEDPVGEESFPYRHYCVNVLDIAYTSYDVLRDSRRQGCGVNKHRDVRPAEEGLRECIPFDPAFPPLTLREEVGAPGKHFAPISQGLNSELYNPPYFSFCDWAELTGSRTCFEPIYGHGCIDTLASIYNAPVAVWTSAFAAVKPQVPGGIAARSAVWGFEPFFLDTTAVRQALEVILFEEWKLERK